MSNYQNRLKNSMHTILSQFPSLIVEYPPSEQELLKEFLELLRNHDVDTHSQRRRILTSFNHYIRKHNTTQRYFDSPFLWFSVSFFEIASQLLSMAEFYANQFYEYLIHHLREIFALLTEGII